MPNRSARRLQADTAAVRQSCPVPAGASAESRRVGSAVRRHQDGRTAGSAAATGTRVRPLRSLRPRRAPQHRDRRCPGRRRCPGTGPAESPGGSAVGAPSSYWENARAESQTNSSTIKNRFVSCHVETSLRPATPSPLQNVSVHLLCACLHTGVYARARAGGLRIL